jgi:hypothetical protein
MPTEEPRNSPAGFALFVATLALMISFGALLTAVIKKTDSTTQASTSVNGSMPMMSHGAGVENVKIVVKSDEEHAKMGSDGSWHDAFLPADFSVRPGSMVRVTVYNYDEGEHSFTSPGLGTNVTIAAGSEEKPAVTTFTFRAPQKEGRYTWLCALPCDPWAMNHNGFMRGIVTVT